MAAGAATTFSPLRGAYLAFSIPALLPLVVHFFLLGETMGYAMGGMLSLFGLLLWRLSEHNYRLTRTSLLLRFENREMIDSLGQAKENAENLYRTLLSEIEAKKHAEAELKAHKDHLEKIVEARTRDLQRTNEELTATKDAAEAANRAKSEFLTNMSHEIRTPLAGALGMIDLVLEMKIGYGERKLLEMARRSTDSLLHLISDLLDFARLEAGIMRFERKPFPLARASSFRSIPPSQENMEAPDLDLPFHGRSSKRWRERSGLKAEAGREARFISLFRWMSDQAWSAGEPARLPTRICYPSPRREKNGESSHYAAHRDWMSVFALSKIGICSILLSHIRPLFRGGPPESAEAPTGVTLRDLAGIAGCCLSRRQIPD